MERYRKVMLRVVDSPGIHQYVITTVNTLTTFRFAPSSHSLSVVTAAHEAAAARLEPEFAW